ncbi:ribonuclease H2 subunit C [Geosmithia morbida]|uniref:Ribonuclease H2 subunit C n=1 Tax=Geosmithia morbida TaxID=1094350 RepID=A0A9P5D730_9HYPO|nr:ribonuclease H2 subunit C [Geosmithia morbida]KAF4125375.1 ribonuclease H2 subunit C [Geosmithia morbida]
MAQPILSIKEADAHPPKSVANLLPCHVHHDGPLGSIDSYWNPTTTEDGTNIAYFRGRRLKGKTTVLPEQYRGVVAERETKEKQQTNGAGQPLSEEASREDGDADAEKPAETGSLRVTAEFDSIVVWGHESVALSEEDPYIRSIEEWLQVSEKVGW